MYDLVTLYEMNGHTTDKWGKIDDCDTHSYLVVYDQIFKRLKDQKNNILEIGIYRGDSLNLWAEYFINSTIYGVDGNLKQIDLTLHNNIHIIEAENAYARNTLKLLEKIGKFDVIIDDGSHTFRDQKYVVGYYSNLLTDNGILIIEDVACYKSAKLKKIYADKLIHYFPDDLKRFVYFEDRRNVKNNINDILVICDKGKVLCDK